jgi:hypothetical protein
MPKFHPNMLEVNVTYSFETFVEPRIALSFQSEERFEFKQDESGRCVISEIWLPWSAAKRNILLFNALIDECVN